MKSSPVCLSFWSWWSSIECFHITFRNLFICESNFKCEFIWQIKWIFRFQNFWILSFEFGFVILWTKISWDILAQQKINIYSKWNNISSKKFSNSISASEILNSQILVYSNHISRKTNNQISHFHKKQQKNSYLIVIYLCGCEW